MSVIGVMIGDNQKNIWPVCFHLASIAKMSLFFISAAFHALSVSGFTCSKKDPVWQKNGKGYNDLQHDMVGSDKKPLFSFFERIFERQLSDSPLQQAKLGRKTDRNGEWDDFSDSHEQEQIDKSKEDLLYLKANYQRELLDEADRLSYDVFVFNSQLRFDNYQFRHHDYVATQHISQVSGLPGVLQNLHSIDNEDDAWAYISRLEKMETVMEQIVELLQNHAERGIIAPALTFPYVIEDAQAIISGKTLYADFHEKVSKLKVDDQKRGLLFSHAEAALSGPFRRGYQSFIDKLQELSAKTDRNEGVWHLPDGGAYYQNRIKYFTTLDLSAEEIHLTGLEEVTRIQEEMNAIKIQVGFTGDLRLFFQFVREDPENYYPLGEKGRRQFLTDARAQIDDISREVHRYFAQLPKAAVEVRRVEPWRENTGGIAFYSGPSADGSRPGIYYANLRDMRSVQKYVFTAITYHEAVPGHHLQSALAQELTGVPSFRKYGAYSAYSEGWAQYAEQLAKEMGFYREPMRNFGRLQNELWRSVRLVVDTGLHVKRWTRAIQYFLDNTPLSFGDIKIEVERYLVVPGQALSYKIGMLEMLNLRSKAKKILCGKFDIRDFHDMVLGSGPLPLPILARMTEAYISKTL